MKNKTQLTAYSAIAVCSIALLPESANAQITYKEIDPDADVAGAFSSYGIDIDDDGNAEFGFGHVSNAFFCTGSIRPDYDLGMIFLSGTYAKAFNYGDAFPLLCCNTTGRINFTKKESSGDLAYGPWADNIYHYIAMSFNCSSGDCFGLGWIRIAANDCGFIIKDFAYGDFDEMSFIGQKALITAGPEIIGTTAITADGAKCKWAHIPGAAGYEILYRKADVFSWTKRTAATTQKTLHGLEAMQEYIWKVRAKTTAGETAFSAEQAFTTLNLKEAGPMIPENLLQVFPNPVKDVLHVHIGEVEARFLFQLSVYDITGREIKNIPLSDQSSLDIDMSDLTDGVYFLQLKGDNAPQMIKFVKQ